MNLKFLFEDSEILLLLSIQDHKNCGEMTEIEAKVKYVKLARSLQTYGVSFFLVKVRPNTGSNYIRKYNI